jgi:tetratricopeptide (TPR) repeat protein
VNACQSALRLKPDLLEARLNLGNVLASQGNVEAAAAEFRRALAQDPNYAPARAALENLQGLARR